MHGIDPYLTCQSDCFTTGSRSYLDQKHPILDSWPSSSTPSCSDELAITFLTLPSASSIAFDGAFVGISR